MTAVKNVLEKHGRRESGLIAMLQDIQKEKGYLPEDDLSMIATEIQVPLSRLYALATFYKAFSLVPRGRHTVKVCMGTACHVRGAAKLVDKMERDFNIKSGCTTGDNRFTLEAVRCVGCCGLAPVVVVDEHFHGKLNQKNFEKV